MPLERPSLDLSNFPKTKERDMSFADMFDATMAAMVEEHDGVEVQMEEKEDPCCATAKEKLAQAWTESNNYSPEQAQNLRDGLAGLSCDEFRRMLETPIGTGPGTDMDNHRKVTERDKRILAEWDACASQSFSGDFTASEDAFEAAWDHLAKGFQDLIDQGEVHLHGTRFMDPDGFDDDTNTALIDYALGERGRYGDERFKYNIMLPTDLALDTLGKPTGVKNRMRASQDGHWRRRKEKFDDAVDSMMLAFGAGRWDRGGKPELPFYPMTIGARLGGQSGLPNESKNISQRDTYANYRDQMLPVVQQALESTTDKLVPVAGSMINTLRRPNISLGVVPGFEGNELGMAAKLLAMQDVGGLSGSATPEATSMNRKMARYLGPRAESFVEPDRRGFSSNYAEFKLKDTEPLVTGNMRSTKDINQLARTITSNPDYFKDEENAPWLQAFGERWQA